MASGFRFAFLAEVAMRFCRHLAFSLAASAAFMHAAWAGNETETPRRVLAAPTRETLKPGARCVIEMQTKADGTRIVYEGVLTRVEDEGRDGLGLLVERREKRVVSKPLMKRTPWLERWLGRNVGIGSSTPDAEVGEDAFLPSVEIHSLKLVVERPEAQADVAPADPSVRPARGRD
jgi:hypothetical protein